MIQNANPALLDQSLDDLFDEPIGIVISSGSRLEPTPRVAEYVWGPVPDAPRDSRSKTPHAA